MNSLYVQVMKQPLAPFVQLLRSAAEPTRLRILALLAQRELSVSDIATVLGQSQPRVSRHLKLLCDAGLLYRSRDQHWIYYRLADAGASAEFARVLIESLDPGDPALALDFERGHGLRDRRTTGDTATVQAPRDVREESGEFAAVLAAELGEATIDALLYTGDAPAAVIAALAGRANRAAAISGSRDDLGRARARLDGPGLARAELRFGDPRSLPFPVASFDAVIADRVDDPELAALREAARVLRPGGRLIAIDDYDRLEDGAVGANPLAVSRDRMARVGLTCTRLRPLDLDRARLLLTIAASAARHEAAA
jgi:DNA-binding transcriptional ArsR family regulator